MNQHITKLIFIFLVLLSLSNSLNPIIFNEKANIEVTSNRRINSKTISDNYSKDANYQVNTDNLSNYNLSVKLIPEQSLIYGNFSLDFINADEIPFNRIPFHLYINAMQYNIRKGQITINEVKEAVENNSLAFEISDDKQLLWISLTSVLYPLERVKLQISFSTILPDSLDRASSYGALDEKIITSPLFYPIPCVYDTNGWNIDPYLDIGDPFYMDMANYEFLIQVPVTSKIVANGELINKYLLNDWMFYYFKPNLPVRQIVFSIGDFKIETVNFNGINISCYYLPSSSYYWENNAIEFSINAISLFNELFGEYPYNILNVVESYGFYNGMEYPCQINVAKGIDTRYFETIIVNEIAHQWWYHMVGTNEVTMGFLDESLSVWSTDYYKSLYYPDAHIFSPYGRTSYVRSYFDYSNGKSSKINQTLYDFINHNDEVDYQFTAYTKAPTILEDLRQKIGHELFILALRHYINENIFKIVTLNSLQLAFEKILNKDLDFYFIPMFNNHYLPIYEFVNVTYEEENKKLTIIIKDNNEILNPFIYCQEIPLYVYNEEGQVLLSNEVCTINGTTSLEITLSTIDTPALIKLYFGQNILFQDFSGTNKVSIRTTNITFITKPSSNNNSIDGFSSFSLIIIFCSIILAKSRRFKARYK